MKASNFTVLPLMLCALGACSSTDTEQKNKLFDYKAAAVKVRTLETPPDLTAPVGNDRYSIPGSDGEGVARYSDFSKAPANGVLPETRNVRLMRDGAQRWLLVNDKAENIWPLVKAFWQEIGLTIKVDNPQAGIMETAWAENLAKPATGGARNVLGGALDDLYSAGERDQYHTRLERGRDGNSTEIYIKQSGQQGAQDADKAACKCATRANDPELEATMLQLLMARLAGGPAVTAAGQQPAAPVPSQAATVKLQTLADGSKRILLGEPFDKSWRKVSLALEQAGIALEDKDRSKGVFFLRAAKGTAGADAAAYQVNVRESAGGCEVTVSNAKGASTPDMQRIIDTLYQNLGKQ